MQRLKRSQLWDDENARIFGRNPAVLRRMHREVPLIVAECPGCRRERPKEPGGYRCRSCEDYVFAVLGMRGGGVKRIGRLRLEVLTAVSEEELVTTDF